MKKTLSIILAACMVMSLAAVAIAAANPDPDGEASGYGTDTTAFTGDGPSETTSAGEVTLNYTVNDGTITNVLAVGLDQTTLDFTFGAPSYTWDPVNLKYKETAAGAGWSEAQTVVVTNYSDFEIGLSASLGTGTYFTVSGNPSGNLASAVGKTKLQLATHTYTITPQGEPTTTASDTLTITATKKP